MLPLIRFGRLRDLDLSGLECDDDLIVGVVTCLGEKETNQQLHGSSNHFKTDQNSEIGNHLEIKLASANNRKNHQIQSAQNTDQSRTFSLEKLFLGKVSQFAFELISQNLSQLKGLKYLKLEEHSECPFDQESKENFLENVSELKSGLLFVSIKSELSDPKFEEKLVELNESLRQRYLEGYQMNLLEKEFKASVLEDLSVLNLERLVHSFSDKNYLGKHHC